MTTIPLPNADLSQRLGVTAEPFKGLLSLQYQAAPEPQLKGCFDLKLQLTPQVELLRNIGISKSILRQSRRL